MAKKKKSRSDVVGGFVFVGFIMIGIGVGLWYFRPDVGVMVGLGIGFISFGIVKLFMKD